MQLRPNANFLEELYEGNKEYAKEMFELFLQITPPEIEVLQSFLENESLEDFSKLAHKVKPTFAMIGLPQLTTLFQELELSSKNNDLGNTKSIFDKNKIFILEGLDWAKSTFNQLSNKC